MWADSGYDGAPLARYETGQPPAKRWGGERTTAGQPHQAAGSPLSTGFKPVDEHLERPALRDLRLHLGRTFRLRHRVRPARGAAGAVTGSGADAPTRVLSSVR
jgi:hypothetical protein